MTKNQSLALAYNVQRRSKSKPAKRTVDSGGKFSLSEDMKLSKEEEKLLEEMVDENFDDIKDLDES